MRVSFLLIIMFLLPVGATAQPLTPQDCQVIRQKYGLVPPQCGGIVDQGSIQMASVPQHHASGGALTASQIENNIFFSRGGTTLDADAALQLDRLSAVLASEVFGNTCIKLVGHSDSSGDPIANRQLSLARAEAVRIALVSRLTRPVRIEFVEGYGEDALLPNLQPNSVWQRRVEIWARTCAVN